MTNRQPTRAVGWWRFFLAAIAAALTVLLGAGTASAVTVPVLETRVGASTPATVHVVGPHECITAGQRWGHPPPQADLVVATGVAAKAEAGAGNTLFHYTDEAGMKGILDSGKLNPSLKSVNPADARYGNGQYLSDIAPGTKTCAQLSRCFLGQPFQGQRFTNYVEINVDGLNVVQGRTGVFVVPGETPLNLTGRIVGFGAN